MFYFILESDLNFDKPVELDVSKLSSNFDYFIFIRSLKEIESFQQPYIQLESSYLWPVLFSSLSSLRRAFIVSNLEEIHKHNFLERPKPHFKNKKDKWIFLSYELKKSIKKLAMTCPLTNNRFSDIEKKLLQGI